MNTHSIGEGRQYVVGDAVEALSEFDNEAAAVFLDDAWARPQRFGQFGVEYDTHAFDEEHAEQQDLSTDITTTKIIDACMNALCDGGWLIADADDWLLPRLIRYIQEHWGDVAATYNGGGYRKIGGVTYTTSDGTVDRSTAGMYLVTGGYPVVFAHKGETNRQSSASARQIAERQHEQYGWGSVKPIEPYRRWVSGLVKSEELILVPCSGTAPAALGAELEFGPASRYVCIDNDSDAYGAFMRRRNAVLPDTEQVQLNEQVSDENV